MGILILMAAIVAAAVCVVSRDAEPKRIPGMFVLPGREPDRTPIRREQGGVESDVDPDRGYQRVGRSASRRGAQPQTQTIVERVSKLPQDERDEVIREARRRLGK